MSLTMETVDAVRTQTIALDNFTGRIVDKILFRKQPRDVTLGSSAHEE
jgi:hypothetical protein